MALVTYLIGPCSGGASILVEFDSSALPVVNGNYYLTFTGATTPGCYDIITSSTAPTAVDVVSTLSIDYGDCETCLSTNPTPTQWPFSGIGVNVQYEYTIGMLGDFSGGTAPAGVIAPHPIDTDATGTPYAQLNSITIGGVNGLNN